MNLLNQIFAIIFYVLLFSWAFFKIRNIILVKKLNCKERYKIIKQNIRKQKLSKCLFIIIMFFLSLIIMTLTICFVTGFIAFTVGMFMMLVTLGGTAYIDTGADPTFYNNIIIFIYKLFCCFSIFKYTHYVLYLIVYMCFARGIYINMTCCKQLNSDFIKNNI